LLNVVRNGYRPFQVAAMGAPGPDEAYVPLLRDRGLVEGQAAVYLCRDFACQTPVVEPQVLDRLLETHEQYRHQGGEPDARA
jgi:uncharacterized protein YyaL (SSP411 family)